MYPPGELIPHPPMKNPLRILFASPEAPVATPAAGLPATPAAGTERIVIPVTGMTCAHCQMRVQKALASTPGVRGAQVDLAAATATADYDRATVAPQALVERIRAEGYGAEVPAASA